MGLKGEKPIIGYKYYLGVHFVPCLGPVDALTRIEVDKKTAWQGNATGGRIVIDAPELFGGQSREGGVSGYVDFLPGESSQGVNDYLQGWRGGLMSAFRGVCSVVLRQAYIGNNPYLKPWAFTIQRIFKGDQGAVQWYPEKAAIGAGFGIGNAGIYFALDASGSMSGARFTAQKQAVADTLAAIRDQSTTPNDIRIVVWSGNVEGAIQRNNAEAADYDELIEWVEDLPQPPPIGAATNFYAAVSQVEEFFYGGSITDPLWDDPLNLGDKFELPGDWGHVGDWRRTGEELPGTGTKRRIVIFVTDGAPTNPSTADDAVTELAKISNCDVYAFNIVATNTTYTEMLDNTPNDGVPVITGGDSGALIDAFQDAFAFGMDMNPAHILREVLIATDTGGTGDEGEIGPSFTAAADQLYSERFGLSLFWANPRDRASFKQIVESHIDGNCFVNRETGQWDIKLIRDDYDVNDLPVFDRSNVVSWSDVTWPDPASLPNQITLVYTDRAKDEPASITLTNTARALSGPIINKKVEYEGVRRFDLAARLAARDLRAMSNPLCSGTLRATNVPLDVNLGSAIVLNNPRLGIENIVARVVELNEGDGRDNAVEIKFVEDKFAFSTDVVIAEPDTAAPGATTDPQPATLRLVEEAPYYAIMRNIGQDEADARLAAEPDLGLMITAAKAPTTDAIDFVATIDAGAGYFDQASSNFSPGVTLLSSLSREADDVVIMVERNATLSGVRIGSLASIGGEYARVDAIQSTAGFFDMPRYFARDAFFDVGAMVTLGRGCLDTVPEAHAAGAGILFWSDNAGTDETEYFAGEEVDVKLRPRTGKGTLRQSLAPTDTVTFGQRALRPYPVGAFKLGGGYVDTVFGDSIEITWAHRDRLTQTTAVYEDHTASSIGPEAGVKYVLVVDALDDAGDVLFEAHRRFVTGTSATVTAADLGSTFFDAPFFGRAKYFLGDVFFDVPFFERPIYFTGLTAAVAALEIRVETWRDGLTNWQTPKARAVPFRAPTSLTIEEI